MSEAQDMTEDKVTMTRWELEKEREHAVIHEKVRQFDELIPRVVTMLEAMEKNVAAIPHDLKMEILECRDRMDDKLKSYMHKQFITESDLNEFESKLEIKIDSVNIKVTRAAWMVSGAFTAATFVGIVVYWILTHTNIQVT